MISFKPVGHHAHSLSFSTKLVAEKGNFMSTIDKTL